MNELLLAFMLLVEVILILNYFMAIETPPISIMIIFQAGIVLLTLIIALL